MRSEERTGNMGEPHGSSSNGRDDGTTGDARTEWLTWAREALPQALAGLSPQEQRLVIAFYFDQQAVEDLAETLGLSPERVQAQIEESLRVLRQRLAAEKDR